MNKCVLSLLLLALLLSAAQFFAHHQALQNLELRLAAYENETEKMARLRRRIANLQQAVDILEQTQSDRKENQAIKRARYQPSGLEEDDPYLGPKEAPVLVQAFLDYQCAPCRTFVAESLPLLKEEFITNGTLKFLLRDFPLSANPMAVKAASFAHCAGEQGAYWDAFALLYSKESESLIAEDRFDTLAEQLPELDVSRLRRCTNSSRYEQEIANDKAEGKEIGAVGAPGFFIGARNEQNTYEGVFIRGAQPYAIFKQQLLRLTEVH